MFSRRHRKQLEAWLLYFPSVHNDVANRSICAGAGRVHTLGPPPDVLDR